MSSEHISRREFMRSTSVVAAGALAGAVAGKAEGVVDKSKIVNYNEKMHYRRMGKTGLMTSEVSFGSTGETSISSSGLLSLGRYMSSRYNMSP